MERRDRKHLLRRVLVVVRAVKGGRREGGGKNKVSDGRQGVRLRHGTALGGRNSHFDAPRGEADRRSRQGHCKKEENPVQSQPGQLRADCMERVPRQQRWRNSQAGQAEVHSEVRGWCCWGCVGGVRAGRWGDDLVGQSIQENLMCRKESREKGSSHSSPPPCLIPRWHWQARWHHRHQGPTLALARIAGNARARTPGPSAYTEPSRRACRRPTHEGTHETLDNCSPRCWNPAQQA